MDELLYIQKKADAFKKSAHAVLGKHEAAKSRVVILEDTYNELGTLAITQDDLFRQALRCAENGLYRAAHVMAWAAFVDFIQERLASDSFVKLRRARRNWSFNSTEELRDNYPERQIVEACKDTRLCTRNEVNALIGLLSTRHQCAHPSDYFPQLNETLGYISTLLLRLETIRSRPY